MQQFTKVLAALALLCISAGAIEMHSYVHEYAVDHNVTFVRPRKIAYPDNIYMYMYCMNTEMPHMMNCNMTMMMANNTQIHCNNTMFVEPETHEIIFTDPMMFQRIGHKIVFEWFSQDKVNGYKYQYKKVSIIDMHHCQVHNLEFPLDHMDMPNHQVVGYHNMIDVYVNSKVMCGEVGQCIMRYNGNGEQIGQPIPFTSKYTSVYSMHVDYHHPEKGAYFAGVEFSGEGGVLHLTHVSHNGVETELFTIPMENVSLMKRMMGSHAYDLYGLCYYKTLKSTGVTCVQYNMTGHKVMEDTVEIDHNDVIIGAHNMMNGGYMLVHRGCHGDATCNNVNVTMFHDNKYQHFILPDVEYQCVSPSNQLVVDHVMTATQHCFHFGCAHVAPTGMSTFKHINKCINVSEHMVLA